MRLEKIVFETYKAFKDPQEFNLRPITIIVGKNSSGKSAVSRLPLLLSKSFAYNSDEPLKIQFEKIEFGGSFSDLIYNKFPHGSIRMELVFSDIKIQFEIQNISDSPIQVISYWSMVSKDSQIELKFQPEQVLNKKIRAYEANGELVLVIFKGLIPTLIQTKDGEEPYKEILDILRSDLMEYFTNIDYIGPLREPPNRVYQFSGSSNPSLGYKGEFAPQILGMASFLDQDLLTNVGSWFKTHLGREIAIARELKSFELVLIDPEDPSVKINLVDVGQGMGQVLPLVVRCFTPKKSNSITIIEQPELHLHPAAHGDLAELFVKTAIEEDSIFIIETHSENMLLRIRRLISEKKLKSKDVLIYWIDDEDEGNFLKEIFIDEAGKLSDWPKGVFSEDYEELLAINAAQNQAKK